MRGVYYDGKTSQAQACSAHLNDQGCLEFGEVDVEPVSVEDLSVSQQLASLPRQVFLPDGALFETQDQQGITELIEAIEGKPLTGNKFFSVSFYETNAKALVVATLFAAALTVGFFIWGIPLLSGVIANNLPAEVRQSVSAYTIEMLDENYFAASELSAQEQQEIRTTFARLKQNTDISDASLLFRGGDSLGANAFALPGGEVVVTDKLVEMAESQDEIAAVLLHELAHIKLRHSLKKLVESASLYLFISLWLGDIEAMESFSVLLFYALLDTKYSRDYERAADAFVLTYARHHSKSIASGFVQIMERIEASEPGFFSIAPENRAEAKEKSVELEKEKQSVNPLNYLSTHPITEERLESFRQFIDNEP